MADIVDEEVDLESVVDAKSYEKAIAPLERGVKKIKRATKELKEVLSEHNLTAGQSPYQRDESGDDGGSAMPKGKESVITRDQMLAIGLPPSPRGNAFKDLVLKVDEMSGQLKLQEIEVDQNEIRGIRNQAELKGLQAQVKAVGIQAKVGMGLVSQGMRGIRNPIGFVSDKVLGAVGKFLPIGMAITLATAIFEMIKGMFGDGGLFDVRKLVSDQVSEYYELQFLNQVNKGEIFLGLGGEITTQGIGTSGSNTLRHSYAHLTDQLDWKGM